MNISSADKKWAADMLEKVHKKMQVVAVRSREKLPSISVDGTHVSRKDYPTCWTNGFWGGMMWLLYNETGCEEYKKTALRSEELLYEGFMDFDRLHHDVGFMWHITAGARHKILGDDDARVRNLFMASLLMSRFVLGGNFIRAWNSDEAENNTIIDTLMNVAQLYFASEITNDDRFKRVAMAHVDTTMRDHVREDGSTVHIVKHSRESGEKIKDIGGQGYDGDSCWSRGLSWAVYGFTISYIHTGKKEYMETAIKCADYYISECEKSGYVPLLDFKAPCEPVYYDSTAGVITACGLIEIAKHLENDGQKYFDAAMKTLKATEEKCCCFDENTDYIVDMGSVHYPREGKAPVHIPIIYGDFFFTEALCKICGKDFLIW